MSWTGQRCRQERAHLCWKDTTCIRNDTLTSSAFCMRTFKWNPFLHINHLIFIIYISYLCLLLHCVCVCVCGTNPGRKSNLRMIPGNFYVLLVTNRVQNVLYFNCYSINRSFSRVSKQCFSAEGIGLFTLTSTYKQSTRVVCAVLLTLICPTASSVWVCCLHKQVCCVLVHACQLTSLPP